MRRPIVTLVAVGVAVSLLACGVRPAYPSNGRDEVGANDPFRVLLPLLVRRPASGAIWLYAGGGQDSPVAYTIDENQVWVGPDTSNPAVYRIVGNRLMRPLDNEVQYTFSGNQIYRGSTTEANAAAYTLADHQVYQGSDATGYPLLSFVGNRTHWGGGPAGPVMLTASVPIESNWLLEFLLPVLLLERF